MMTATTATAKMTEEQAVGFLRNALLVAGHEMGETGDHWPVIKSTINKIMKDWETYQLERSLSGELKKCYADLIDQIEKDVKSYPADHRAKAEKILREIREVYEARFSPIDLTMFVVCDEDVPIHIRRANAITKTLEDDND